MRQWVDTVPEISELLSSNEPAYFVPEPDMVFLYMHEAERKEKRIVKGKKAETSRIVNEKKQMAVTLPSISTARKQMAASFPSITTAKKQPLRHSQIGKPALVTVRGQAVYHDQVIALKRIFDTVDRNKDGTWSLEEFRARLPQAPTLQRISESLFRQFDGDASGSITFDELLVKTFRGLSQRQLTTVLQWVTAWEAQHYMKLSLPQVTRKHPPSIRTLQEFQTLFHLYDTNKDGMLSPEELKEGLKHMFSLSDIEAMFKKYDENGDRNISLSEFLKLMSPDDT